MMAKKRINIYLKEDTILNLKQKAKKSKKKSVSCFLDDIFSL